MRALRFLLLGLVVCFAEYLPFAPVARAQGADSSELNRYKKLEEQGNYRDAYQGYKKLLERPDTGSRDEREMLEHALVCLSRLGETAAVDELLSDAVSHHAENWNLLLGAAKQYGSLNKFGYIVGGKFSRGYLRGGDGKYVSTRARDRIAALRLLVKAAAEMKAGRQPTAGARDREELWLTFAETLIRDTPSWQLQALSDLSKLPDYDDSQGWYSWNESPGTHGAPVDEKGNPVYYSLPKDFDSAASDGERLRFVLAQAMQVDAVASARAELFFAHFLRSQFGTETLSPLRIFGGRDYLPSGDSGSEDSEEGADSTEEVEKSGPYALQTLADDETLTRLASGIRRFRLPDEFNYLKILQRVAETRSSEISKERTEALRTLGAIFENRRQFPRAAEYWEKAGDSARVRNIVGAWGRFENVKPQTFGRPAELNYVFRNGASVDLEAFEIDTNRLLEDAVDYLKSNPMQLDWDHIQTQLGPSLFSRNQKKYLGKSVFHRQDSLHPADKHFDRTVKLKIPLQKPGAYLIRARIAGGNLSDIVVWLTPGVLLNKPLANGGNFYFLADADRGSPVADAELRFFGYKTEYLQHKVFLPGMRRYDVKTLEFVKKTDSSGRVITSAAEQPLDYRWTVVASVKGRPEAMIGFSTLWYGGMSQTSSERVKTYIITDRPVYRPGQTVRFKAWIAWTKYGADGSTDFADKSFLVRIFNARNEKVFEKKLPTDTFGGLNGEFPLPADAQLGAYTLQVKDHGQGTFRVEEYKKPEFEVRVEAPSEPVLLGETIHAKVSAKYYFGEPVRKGQARIKVERSDYESGWYPAGEWDWLYGAGYWWFAYDYDWFPGFSVWGCRKPHPIWFPRQSSPPELVQEMVLPLGSDGTVDVLIDTATAKKLQRDRDHKYSISAEVVDDSRRMVSGTGEVIAARKPFEVHVWVDRGFYQRGDTVRANFAAQTAARKPVQGRGSVRLFKIAYDAAMKPQETEIQQWPLDTREDGTASLQITAAKSGQYRLLYRVEDSQGHRAEGGYVFSVMGEGAEASDFHFNDIEIIPEKREYAAGEQVRLQINTAQPDSTVLLFVRPSGGSYPEPKVLRLHGKSLVQEIRAATADMPNFFVEAATIHDGRIFNDVREIFVPPVKKILNVEIQPSSSTYKPGEEATYRLQIRDPLGKAFPSSAVLTAYDSAVDYISGGSNVADIRSFFWKFRHGHQVRQSSNVDEAYGNMTEPDEQGMSRLGLFGAGFDVLFLDNGGAEEKGGILRRQRGKSRETTAFDGADFTAGVSGANLAGAYASKVAAFKPEAAAPADAESPALVQPVVRKEFADTAYWNPSIEVDDQGRAVVHFRMPENLTEWKVRAWVLGRGTQVGEAEVKVTTAKKVLVRLQAPRFFVEKDEVVLSANIHNYLNEEKSFQARLELPGDTLQALDAPEKSLTIAAGGEARVDWRVRVLKEGQAVVRMAALSDSDSDAMEMKFPVYVHGMLRTESFSGALRPEDSAGELTFRVPAERRPEQSRVEIRYSPSLAASMVDALPYLVNYPYGCTEQTLNRFLPTAITLRLLQEMKLDLKKIRDKRNNLNAQEIGDAKERAAGWKRYKENPVFDPEEVAAMARSGLARLAQMQLSDGGWGWFFGTVERSDAHMTATVVHGLQAARAADLPVEPSVVERGVSWLEHYQAAEVQKIRNAKTKTMPWKKQADNIDALVFMVLTDAGQTNSEMLEYLYRDRNSLTLYGKALFGLGLEKLGQKEKLSMILQNIGQYVVEDPENQTAYLKLGNQGYWWYWYGSEYETEAAYLKLLSRVEPKGKRAAGLVKYLLNNRKNSTYWNSTRDTALVLEAFGDYLRASGENQPDMNITIAVDGKVRRTVKINAENLFSYDDTLVLSGNELTDGTHEVKISKTGRGALYFNAYVSNFSLEDHLQRAGLEVKVQRRFYKLQRQEKALLSEGAHGQALQQKTEKFVREPLAEGATVKSGDLIEVELEIESKNDYEYLAFEDFKPAGFEPLEVRSGYNGNDLNAYVEFHDERVVFFARTLARGKHSVSYRLRAETPGRFSALPAKASAMYAPEIRANSDEMKIAVED
jgi:uncharacterized protein YfaS (alpha-2-macroglobulin family)